MGKKLKKDFKERQRARIEKETLQSNGSIEPEESKLKHNDDYRGKIVHDKDRFQDKVHEKVSKRSIETEQNLSLIHIYKEKFLNWQSKVKR